MTNFIQNRRTFLKTGTVLVGGVLLFKYIEPIVPIAEPKKHEWVEDKGDFYIVRVPDTKSFVNETLDKPTIFLLGENTLIKGLNIKGYINVAYKGNCAISDLYLDTSKMTLPNERSLMYIENGSKISSVGVLHVNNVSGLRSDLFATAYINGAY